MSDIKTIDDFFQEVKSQWSDLQVNPTRDKFIAFYELVQPRLHLMAERQEVSTGISKVISGSLNWKYSIFFEGGLIVVGWKPIFGRRLQVENAAPDGNGVNGVRITEGYGVSGRVYMAEKYRKISDEKVYSRKLPLI